MAAAEEPPLKRAKSDHKGTEFPLTELWCNPVKGLGGFALLRLSEHQLFDRLYDSLMKENELFGQETLRVFGKEVPLPRTVAHLGETYRFSGQEHSGTPFDEDAPGALGLISRPLLVNVVYWALCSQKSALGGGEAVHFKDHVPKDWAPNECILNRYEEGSQYIGMHSDDEANLADPTVVMITLGAERTWHLRSKLSVPGGVKPRPITIRPRHGDIHIMVGALQEHWKHGMPKCADSSIVPYKGSKVRFSLTFRQMKTTA